MVYTDAENEAQTAWRTQEISWDSNNPNGSKGVGYSGGTFGNQSFRPSGADWQGRNPIRKFGEDTGNSGGTVAQLITELEEEIIESEARLARLHNHLEKFRSLQNQLGEE